MRILFITDFYPPIRAGGYGQLCQEVAEAMRARHHEVRILTSRYHARQMPHREPEVFRKLYLDFDPDYYQPLAFFRHWRRQLNANLKITLTQTKTFQPELVLIWNMRGLSKAIAALVEKHLPDQVVYYLAGWWPVTEDVHRWYWDQPTRRRLTGWAKKLLRVGALKILGNHEPPVLDFKHAVCVSAALKNQLTRKGMPLEHAAVIRNGIQVSMFHDLDRGWPPRIPEHARLLYAGQLAEHKGIHTAIEALAGLDALTRSRVHLTILGRGHPDYEYFLRQLVEDLNLKAHISFKPWIPRGEMPDFLRRFDGLVFPSIYEEPLARIVQEAMACGLYVLGTTTGGMKEILEDGKNSLVFQPRDAAGLRHHIQDLLTKPGLARHLAKAGYQTVCHSFTIERMVSEIERYLWMVFHRQPVAGFHH